MTLLQTPNMSQTWDDFWSNNYLLFCGGEAPIYGDAIIPTRLPKELIILRPDWLTRTLSNQFVGQIAEWRYTASDNASVSMSISPANLLMFKAFDPLCRYRGLSPLTPCCFCD